MPAKIKSDTLQALADWKAGKPVRSLELGHVHRMKEHPGGGSPVVDLSVRLSIDQERLHAYCFHIIASYAENGVKGVFDDADDHEEFLAACDALEQQFRSENEGLTAEELDAAEGLAWKALHVGWGRAIAGHDPEMYIEVSRAAVSAT